jgi:predicted aminopeptidase
MRPSISRALAALPLLVLSGCGLPYYWQAVGGQLDLLHKRVPIATILVDSEADPQLVQSLHLVEEIRQFAISDLALPVDDSYTTYADVGRPYVVWNVVATEEFSVDPIRWCFPIAGCVAYRGFFDRRDAEKYESKLRADGLDTYSAGSAAYSTLGYFSDPVLNTMLAGGAEYVAPMLFHELAHQKMYVKGDSELSEAFASVIEEFGTERWLRARGAYEALGSYRERLRRRRAFAELIADTRRQLADVYDRPWDDGQKRSAKRALFERLQADYAALRSEWENGENYDEWFARTLNNASLASVGTYRRWMPALRWRLDRVGLGGFYESMQALANLEPEERTQRLQSWDAESLTASALSEGR